MRNFVIVLLAVAVLLLFIELHSKTMEIRGLTAASVSNLEIQDKCAKQAAVEFRQEGLEEAGTASFTNHYSSTLGHCFVVTSNETANDDTFGTHKLLVDAYEGRVYGTYEWTSIKGRKYWEVAPAACEVTLPSGTKQMCKSEEEWDELVKSYTETK